MTSAQNESQALGAAAARQLANATKTVPQLSTITPRWLLHLLSWVPVEAGIYRVNRVVNPEQVAVHWPRRPTTSRCRRRTSTTRRSPRELTLRPVATMLDVHTRVSDLYSSPHDQVAQQLRLTIETIKEHQESELINNADYGLLSQVAPEQRIRHAHRPAHPRRPGRRCSPRCGRRPSFFLTHPLPVWPRSVARPPGAACRRRR